MTVGRDTRRMHVERFLASGMELEGWCMLNGIHKSSMYRWMRAFIEEEPEVFGGYDIAHAGDGSSRWLECILEARRRAFSIERAQAAEEAPAGFIELDLPRQPFDPAPARPEGCLVVSVGRATVAVPYGAPAADVESVLKAVASL